MLCKYIMVKGSSILLRIKIDFFNDSVPKTVPLTLTPVYSSNFSAIYHTSFFLSN